MGWDFSAILLLATLASGLIYLVDVLYWKKQRAGLDLPLSKDGTPKEPLLIEYARSFFPVLLFVFLLRSFIVEPFRIPSGSMKPTLLVGDFIVVNKFTYGVRLPVIQTKIWPMGEPKRGDVMVFRYPVDPSVNFIKRVIGLPGDEISYEKKVLMINGKEITKVPDEHKIIVNDYGAQTTIKHFQEDLLGVNHEIYERFEPGREVGTITVPEGHYFMMGDNRDDSDDSRLWGFVPESYIVGKAFAIWMSWDSEQHRIRFDRIGDVIQ